MFSGGSKYSWPRARLRVSEKIVMIPLESRGLSQVARTDDESMTVTVKFSGASGAVIREG